MAIKQLAAGDVGLPSFAGRFDGEPAGEETHVFDLHSHRRAREAIEVGLALDGEGYNVFVLGEDRTGRMSATRRYLERHVSAQGPCCDWVYLNNFRRPNKPKPYRLPRGAGRRLRDRVEELVPAVREALVRAFGSESYQAEARREAERRKGALEAEFAALREMARERGLDVWMTAQGMQIVVLGADGEPMRPEQLMALPAEEQQKIDEKVGEVTPTLAALRKKFGEAEAERVKALREINRRVAETAVGGLLDQLQAEFELEGVGRWLQELRDDIVEHIHLFQPREGEDQVPEEVRRRYAVNLMVDNADNDHPLVVVEPNPTYENLFGTIEYRAVSGMLTTDFTMIRPGALHRANGGILVLRAEAMAMQPYAWHFLKDALRDREIRIEELHRMGSVPMSGTPKPRPIPLEVRIFLVGAPVWYYRFFALDSQFKLFFKVKADIDSDMPAGDRDVALYARLVQRLAIEKTGRHCTPEAIDRILAQLSRWADDRRKLSARVELVEDLLIEASLLVKRDGREVIELADVRRALAERRRRNARIEDRAQERIHDGAVMIDTDGAVVGQVNGLVYSDLGDHVYGLPSRITARTHAGPHGIINIERMTAMGGPIQQKSVLIVEGYLDGLFGQAVPPSFSCSITFEQTYGGVEGDSASLAELCAIVSALAEVPIRQDIALTGSMNQRGEVQPIGGANEKAEGFFRTCQARGLTGRQGVIVPAANEVSLAVDEGLAAAVSAGHFHVWSVATVEDVIELLTGLPAGQREADGSFPADSVYGRAMATLVAYDRALTERAMHRR